MLSDLNDDPVLDELLALVVADRLTGGKKAFLAKVQKVRGYSFVPVNALPHILSQITALLEPNYPDLTIPAIHAIRIARQNPKAAEHVMRDFAARVIREIYLPQIKIGEGIGQARKLTAWIARAIETQDINVYPQLLARSQSAIDTTKDHISRLAFGLAIRWLAFFAEPLGKLRDIEMAIRYASRRDTASLGAILSDILRSVGK